MKQKSSVASTNKSGFTVAELAVIIGGVIGSVPNDTVVKARVGYRGQIKSLTIEMESE